MSTQIAKEHRSQIVSAKDLPVIGKFMKDIGLPILILIGVVVLLFKLNQQGQAEKTVFQSKADDCVTEMINLLKQQNADVTNALNEQNILQRETNELMRDIKHELKK